MDEVLPENKAGGIQTELDIVEILEADEKEGAQKPFLNESLPVDYWESTVVSPIVYHNVYTNDIHIPSAFTQEILSKHNDDYSLKINLCNKESKIEASSNVQLEDPETIPTAHNLLISNENYEIFTNSNSVSSPLNINTNEKNDCEPLPKNPHPPESESKNSTLKKDEEIEWKEEEDASDDTVDAVIVTNLQELVLKNVHGKNCREEHKRFLEKYPTHSTSYDSTSTLTGSTIGMETCIKYKVVQNPSGVTTISIDPTSSPPISSNISNDGSNVVQPPIIHHVINLPPRRIHWIRQKRRERDEHSSFSKSSRLSQIMLADFKLVTSGTVSESASKTSAKAIGNAAISTGRKLELMKRKVGRWCRKQWKSTEFFPTKKRDSGNSIDLASLPSLQRKDSGVDVEDEAASEDQVSSINSNSISGYSLKKLDCENFANNSSNFSSSEIVRTFPQSID